MTYKPHQLGKTIVLSLPWGEMSRVVRYRIVVECDEIVFCDNSRARRRMGSDRWELVGHGHELEAGRFCRLTDVDPRAIWPMIMSRR